MPRGAAMLGVVGLLGHVRRGVVAGQRVLGVEQADQGHVQRDPQDHQTEAHVRAEPGVVDRLREHRAEVGPGVLVEQDADDDDHGDADDVPPHRHVVEQRDEPDPEGVQQRVQDEDDGVHRDRALRADRVADRQVEQRRREHREAEVDAGGHGDLADEVEPADEPAPLRRVAAGLGRELRGPVVEAAGGRIARRDLGHAEGDEDHEEADDEPAQGHDRRAARVHREQEQRQAARQDRDDRERDREVGERLHPAPELLGIPQLMKLIGVLGAGTTGRCGHPPRPSSALPGIATFAPSDRALDATASNARSKRRPPEAMSTGCRDGVAVGVLQEVRQGWAIGSRARSRSSPARGPASGGRARSGSRRRARGSPASTSTATPSRPSRARSGTRRSRSAADVSDRGPGQGLHRRHGRPLGPAGRGVQQRRHQHPGRVPRGARRGHRPHAQRQRQGLHLRLPLRDPAHARAWRRLADQHDARSMASWPSRSSPSTRPRKARS